MAQHDIEYRSDVDASKDDSGGNFELRRQVMISHDNKERKMRQLTALTSQQQVNCSYIAEGNKKKMEFTSRVHDNRGMIEELQKQVANLEYRAEVNETKGKSRDRKIEDLSTSIELEVKRLEQKLLDTDDKVKAEMKKQETYSNDLGAELRDLISNREKKITLSVDAKLADEAHSRHQAENDIAKLSEQLKDLKAALGDEVSKLLANIESNAKKTSDEFLDLQNLMNAERTTRERSITSARNDAKHANSELKSVVDAKSKELSKDMKHIANQLTFMLDNLNTDMQKDVKKRDELLEIQKREYTTAFDSQYTESERKMKEIVSMVNTQVGEARKEIESLKDSIANEVVNRKRDRKSLDEQLLQEHLVREQDESRIILLMETLMKQVKNMNMFDAGASQNTS